jgi:hypothetical protein
MKPVSAPVKPGEQSASAAALQDALNALGFQISQDERQKQLAGESTTKMLRTLQRQFQINISTELLVDDITADMINKLLKEKGLLDTKPPKNFSVTGVIITDDARPMVGTLINAVDKRVAGDIVLGRATTDTTGAYTINYTSEQLQGKDSPDLEIDVMQLSGQTLVKIAASDIKYNASTQEKIDVIVKRSSVIPPPEYNRLRTDIQPYAGDIALRNLKEDEQNQHITLLSNRTGWDARLVAMAAQADVMSAAVTSGNGSSGIPASHYYALFRAGIAGNADAINSVPIATVEGILKNAMDTNVIPTDNNIASTLRVLQAQQTEFLLKKVPALSVSNLDSMLSIRLNDTQRRVFTQTFQETSGDATKLWPALAQKGIPPETISKLQLDGKMGYLTLQNSPLINRIYSKFPDVKDPSDLALKGLYKPSEWKNIIGNDVPKDVNVDDYATNLANLIKISYPTAVVSAMIQTKELPLSGNGAVTETAQFLASKQNKFTIGVQPVKTWEGFSNLKPETQSTVRRVERLYQMSPSNESMSALAKTGLHSAYQVVQFSRNEFLDKYSSAFPSAVEADKVYTKAHEVHSEVINLASSYLTQRINPNVYGITGKLQKEQSGVSIAPTLEELLGNMDYCSCDHCKSVLSPAAYLVELLQFIELKDIKHDKDNPLDVLLSRRPDIQHLQLSCENTNTVLPYIDLVNEVLEYYIVNGNLTNYKQHDADEFTNTADLLADPQFVIDNAYVETGKKVYPYNLPFNQPLEALRLFFNAWDTSLADALANFKTPLIAQKEILGLNKEELRILTDKTAYELPQFFGLAAGTSMATLNATVADAKEFSRRMEISYEDLVSLLKTSFINPAVTLVPGLQALQVEVSKIQDWYDAKITDAAFDALLPTTLDLTLYPGGVRKWLQDNKVLLSSLITLTDMKPGAGECNFANVELRYTFPTDVTKNQLDEIAYHRLHRFLRLLKKLDWKIETLDLVLNTLLPVPSKDLNTGNIDAAFVTLMSRLANFKSLLNKLSLSEKKIPAWVVLFDTTKAIAERHLLLAKLLKMSETDISALTAITSTDPLANDLQNDSPSFPAFLDLRDKLKAVPIKVVDLNYLLRHIDDSNLLTPPNDLLLKNTKLLHDIVAGIDKDYSSPANADLGFAKAKMSLVYDSTIVDDFFGLLDNSKTFSTPFNTIEEALPQKVLAADSNISFDPFTKSLSYRGIITDALQTALNTAVDSLVIADMSEVQAADLAAYKTDLKNAITQLKTLGNNTVVNLTTGYPELKTAYDAVKLETDPAKQLTVLSDAILPELRTRLKYNALQQALPALTKSDGDTVIALTRNPLVLHAITNTTKSILDDFIALTSSTAFNANGTYNFYIDPVATDNYILYVKAPQNTVVSLTVDGNIVVNNVTIGAGEETETASPLALTTGKLNAVKLDVASLPASKSVEILWRTKAIAKSDVPASNVYDKAKVTDAQQALIRLQKAAQLQQLLKLTMPELEYFVATHPATKNIMNELPVNTSISDADVHNLWNKLSLLIDFVLIRNENEPLENTWLQIIQNPDALTAQGKSLLLSVNYWKDADLTAVLSNKGFTKLDLSDISKLTTVKHAMDYVTGINYPATNVISWVTDVPTARLIKDIKTIVRANTDDAAWYDTMNTISEALRNKMRDALVSYILHYMPAQLPAEINNADKLYEYFLIDVQMDSCMKTSRIKQAISTVQLFIYRCLMNLETKIDPGSIRASQWEWMKRYRIWEANRKIFLYPENWLEPELRDNKSSFYKELEGELLGADINNDLAETAFLNYLKKLDDIATLEVAGMFVQENEQGNQDDDIIHVFGRTNGTTRDHYYRRFEYGYWTPWEKISMNIQGDILFPVVWKSRLFLFWLTIVEKPAASNNSKSPQGMSTEGWGVNAKTNVEITMCWGEYYKNKWTSPKSTELNTPIFLENLDGFNRKEILLYARTDKSDTKVSERLIFNLYYLPAGLNNGLFNILYTSKNAPPTITKGATDLKLQNDVALFNFSLYRQPYNAGGNAYLSSGHLQITPNADFSVGVTQPPLAAQPTVTEKLFTKSASLNKTFSLLPLRHRIENQWEAPLFYLDDNSQFFTAAAEKLTAPIYEFQGYFDPGIIYVNSPDWKIDIPPLVEKPKIVKDPGDLVKRVTDPVIDNWSRSYNSINDNYSKGLSTPGSFTFGNAVFGVGGNIAKTGFNVNNVGNIAGNIANSTLVNR